MRFVNEIGFCVARGKEEAFQAWLTKNEARLAKSYPPGCEYLGTYVAVFATDKHGGEYRAIDLLDSYAALDRMAAAAKDPKSAYGKLVRQLTGFLDWERTDDWSNGLYKSVVDATLWDQPTD
jgi:hypothetical protein